MLNKLFSPLSIGDVILKNRIVMAPMTRGRAHNEGLVPTPSMVEYYRLRAEAGLIITEGAWTSREAIGFINVPGLFTKEQVAGWRQVTDAVHEAGGNIFAQLGHIGGLSHPEHLNGELPLAPSAVDLQEMAYAPGGFAPTVVPREMTLEDIRRTIDDYRHAALNAMEAGFDGVEVHGAYLYLLPEFLNSATNIRTDAYGGSPENRARIVIEIVESLLTVLESKQVALKLSPGVTSGLVTANADNDATYSYLVRKLNDYDLAYLHGWQFPAEPGTYAARFVDLATYLRPLYNGTLIISGGFDADSAEAKLQSGHLDAVAIGTPFIANPDLVRRYREGLPLAQPHRDFLYAGGDEGYLDYPLHEDAVTELA
jgi:N-ethylmaleimide reductase